MRTHIHHVPVCAARFRIAKILQTSVRQFGERTARRGGGTGGVHIYSVAGSIFIGVMCAEFLHSTSFAYLGIIHILSIPEESWP